MVIIEQLYYAAQRYGDLRVEFEYNSKVDERPFSLGFGPPQASPDLSIDLTAEQLDYLIKDLQALRSKAI